MSRGSVDPNFKQNWPEIVKNVNGILSHFREFIRIRLGIVVWFGSTNHFTYDDKKQMIEKDEWDAMQLQNCTTLKYIADTYKNKLSSDEWSDLSTFESVYIEDLIKRPLGESYGQTRDGRSFNDYAESTRIHLAAVTRDLPVTTPIATAWHAIGKLADIVGKLQHNAQR